MPNIGFRHSNTSRLKMSQSHVGVVIPPFHFAVWFHGWLAGLFDPARGGAFAAGSAANEEEFKAALRAAMAKEGG